MRPRITKAHRLCKAGFAAVAAPVLYVRAPSLELRRGILRIISACQTGAVEQRRLEATAGIEPAYPVLQTGASPLRHVASLWGFLAISSPPRNASGSSSGIIRYGEISSVQQGRASHEGGKSRNGWVDAQVLAFCLALPQKSAIPEAAIYRGCDDRLCYGAPNDG